MRKSTGEGERSGQQTGDLAIIESGFPLLFIDVLAFIAFTMGFAIALRVGNPPRIGHGDDSKSMLVKQNTGAALLYKGLIPIDRAFLRKKSADVDEVIAEFHMNYSDYFGFSQLRVTLIDVLLDEASYETIVVKNGKIYLFPKKDLIDNNSNNFKDPERVKKTVFILDPADRQKLVLDQNQILRQLPKLKSRSEHITMPHWWKPELGDFQEIKSQSIPVYYTEFNKSNDQAPFFVLGGPNAKGAKHDKQKSISGDIDFFWAIPQTQSCLREFVNSGKQFDLSNKHEYKEFEKTFSKIVSRMHLNLLGSSQGGVLLERLNISGCTTASEAALIYMVNKLFSEGAENVSQLILHGSEVYNPNNPSSIESVLHILPSGERILTRNEDELIDLVKSKNFLSTFPIPVHPKWCVVKWADVIKMKIKLNQDLNPQIRLVYEEYKKRIAFKLPFFSTLNQAIATPLGMKKRHGRERSLSMPHSPRSLEVDSPDRLRRTSDSIIQANFDRSQVTVINNDTKKDDSIESELQKLL